MRLRYNAPVTLTFALLSTVILVLDQYLGTNLTSNIFSVPGKQQLNFGRLFDYVRLFTHVVGHANWTHLISNFSFILLLGPILEEKYGSGSVLFMMAVTALATGLINAVFFNTGLLGASGIVFMMILLVSFTNIGSGEIPLTFILVVFLYLSREVMSSFDKNNIAEFAHVIGGLIGSLFGFLRPRKSDRAAG
jgi:rhomboid protease GluP